MRPDRIVVGEVRDAAAIDMLSALNTGQLGLASLRHIERTVHFLLMLMTVLFMWGLFHSLNIL